MSDCKYGCIPDDRFLRGDAPMTKWEIRTLVLGKLLLRPESRVVDVGAGTGAVSIDCARHAPSGTVYAVEREAAACRLIERNRAAFNVTNLEIVQGSAPEALEGLPAPDRVFIGGTGGGLERIFAWVDAHLAPGGLTVLTAVTLETLALARTVFDRPDYSLDILQASVARGERTGGHTLFRAQNPVFILTAARRNGAAAPQGV